MQPAPETKDRAARAIPPLLIALLSYALFLALGVAVAHRPAGAADSASHVLIGHGALLAWMFTWTLYLQWLAPLGIALIVVAVGRPRRMDWIVKRETAMSFSSGHATLAVAFYGFWAYLLRKSPELPARMRTIASGLLIGLVPAVCWSRLALGAHYPSDVLGGILLGISGASAAVGVCAWLNLPLYGGFFGD